MALAEDLLLQAEELARRDANRPTQAYLRRSVSTAYYALFHLLVRDASRRAAPAAPGGLADQIARAFSHAEMKQACKAVSTQPGAVLLGFSPQGFSADLRSVAAMFVRLQEERNDADYDLTRTYTRAEVLDLLARAQAAFAAWKRVRQSDERNVFCAALLFHRSWSR